jgi:hypothetical protein
LEDEGILWFAAGEGILCKNCAAALGGAPGGRGNVFAGPGARRWLLSVENLDPASLYRISLDAPSMKEAENLVRAVLEAESPVTR